MCSRGLGLRPRVTDQSHKSTSGRSKSVLLKMYQRQSDLHTQQAFAAHMECVTVLAAYCLLYLEHNV